jgi:myo-inositol-1(or 4)-monophosphatase
LPAIEAEDATTISARAITRLADAVRDAGSLALSMFGKQIKNWTKGPSSSPVCDADIAVNDLLRERLIASGDACAWLSEESADDAHRLGARHVWVVDPIDGTRAYIAGQPDWAISAALVEDGRPIAACLYAPALDEFFAARAGAGSMLNGAPIAATARADLRGIRVLGPQKFLDRLSSAMPPFTKLPRGHSLALRLVRVAQGAADVAFAGGNSHDWTLQQPIFWCTKRAARSRPWRAELWSIIVPCRGMGCSSQPAGTGTRRSSNFLGIKSFLGTRIFLGTRASHCDNRKPGRVDQTTIRRLRDACGYGGTSVDSNGLRRPSE